MDRWVFYWMNLGVFYFAVSKLVCWFIYIYIYYYYMLNTNIYIYIHTVYNFITIFIYIYTAYIYLLCIYIYIMCVCPRLSLRFSRFYSAGVAESQKDLESLTGEVSEMEKQVQPAGESIKKENDKFSRFYFAGGARTFGASCANEDTHHWLCKRTCRHAMGTVVCSLGANTNINFLTR